MSAHSDSRTLTSPSRLGGDARLTSTSLSLLARVKAHDARAWQRLSDLYGPLAYHWRRKLGLRPEDAADVVQEVFRAVATHIGQFRRQHEQDTFRGWLWTITRNKVRDHARATGPPVRRLRDMASRSCR